jgi:hypothetical protein
VSSGPPAHVQRLQARPSVGVLLLLYQQCPLSSANGCLRGEKKREKKKKAGQNNQPEI